MIDYQRKPHCILGKKGITKEFVEHVNKLLKRYKIIKIKALKSIASKSNIKELANKIIEQTNSYLLDVRGKTMIISSSDINKYS
ncbi:MAG: YhbY family RNA-binding protein [Promethearchaeota archaeon]